MAITSSAPTGVIVTSPAKNGTLASGSTTGAVLDSAIGTNNGNLMGSPTLTGRLIRITGGLGSGQIRYITSDNGTTTIVVNEAWTTVPNNTSTYQISYIIQDPATLTGFGLVNKRVADYSSSRRLTIANTGWLAFLDGVSLETSDNSSTTVADIIIQSGGRFDNGYLTSGLPVSGGYIIGTPAVNGELVLDFQSGSTGVLNDFLITCVYQNRSFFTGDVTWNKAKFFSASYAMDLTGNLTIKNSVIEGKSATTDTLSCDQTTNVDGLTIISTNGFISPNDSVTETISLKNVTFAKNLRKVLVYANKTWDFINPTWTVVTADQTNLSFTGTGNSVRELFALNVTTATADGTAISGASTYMYEGLLNQNLPTTNRVVTNASGLASSNVLKRVFTNNAGTSVNTATYGNYFLKVYNHGKLPFVTSLPFTKQQDVGVTLVTDPNITQTNAASAISAGSGIAITNETNPFTILEYQSGTGTLTVGSTVTGGTSTATGVVVEIIEGNSVAGKVLLKTRNATAYQTSGSTETITASGWSGSTVLGSTVYSFKYMIDCNALQLTTVYDYINAKLAESPVDATFQDLIIWGGGIYAKPFHNGGSGYYTIQNASQGFVMANRGAGTVAYFTSNSGTQYIPPVSYSFNLTGLKTNSEVRLINPSNKTEIAGIENTLGVITKAAITTGGTGYTNGDTLTIVGGTGTAATLTVTSVSGGVITGVSIAGSGSYSIAPPSPSSVTGGTGSGAEFNLTDAGTYSYSYVYSGDVPATAIVFHIAYKDIRISDLVLSNSSQSIPIQQATDRVYFT
mgnify:FL=1